MVFPVVGGNESKVYEISNSLRFNDGDSPDLDITSADGNEDIWTWSAWIKRSTLKSSGEQFLFCGSSNGTTNTEIKLQNDQFTYINYNGSSNNSYIRTNAKLRDTSAWYHLVCSIDMSQSTDTNRIKLYINGVHQTSLDQTTYASQNTDTYMNVNSGTHRIGADARTAANYFDGYMTEINFVDGTAKAQTDFGEFDDNAVWIPKKYTGTYGTNGFFMQFKQTGTSANSSGIGADTSGNDNHYTPANLAAIDITEDTCTNNFCTFNPIDTPHTDPTFSEGNCKIVTQASTYTYDVANFGLSQGKWYFEVKCTTSPDKDYHMVGISSTQPTAHNQELGYHANDYGIYGNGGVNSLRYGATFYSYANAINNGDIVGVALDLDNNKLYFSINGTFQNSSNPANATNPISITDPSSTGRGFYFPAICYLDGANSGTYEANFGNPSFSISSGNNDGKYGNFEYEVPSGFYAICTKRLAEFG